MKRCMDKFLRFSLGQGQLWPSPIDSEPSKASLRWPGHKEETLWILASKLGHASDLFTKFHSSYLHTSGPKYWLLPSFFSFPLLFHFAILLLRTHPLTTSFNIAAKRKIYQRCANLNPFPDHLSTWIHFPDPISFILLFHSYFSSTLDPSSVFLCY